MVLAAGRGSRLGAAAGALPKPLIPLAGRSPVAWNLTWLAAAGAREVWINLHYRGKRIRAALGHGGAFGLSIRYSEEERLLGTAGGWARVAAAHPRLRWLVLYGDNLMRFDLARLLSTHGRAVGMGGLATIALFDPARHRNTGIAGGRAELGPAGQVSRFVEGTAGAGVRGGLVNAGAYVLEPQVLGEVDMRVGEVDFGRHVLPRLAASGRLYGHVLEPAGFCLGVDTVERLQRARAMLATAEVAP